MRIDRGSVTASNQGGGYSQVARTRLCDPILRWLCLVLVLGFGGVSRVGAQSEDGPITIAQLHIFLMPVGETLVVTEHYLLSNLGDEVFMGGGEDGATVHFPLPASANNVQLSDPTRFIQLDGSLADTQPIPPGEGTTEVRFTYDLPLNADAWIEREMPAPVQAAVIVLAGASWRLDGPGIVSLGPMAAGDTDAQAYTADPLAAGERLSFRILASGMSASSGMGIGGEPAPAPQSEGVVLGIGVLAVVIAALGAAMVWRSAPSLDPPDHLRADIRAIAGLDRRYEAGDLDQQRYRAERERLIQSVRGHLRPSGDDD